LKFLSNPLWTLTNTVFILKTTNANTLSLKIPIAGLQQGEGEALDVIGRKLASAAISS
jgi:hypothetical protein